MEDYQNYQLQQKEIPRDIEFYDEHGSLVIYRIQDNDDPNGTSTDFYPVRCQQRNNTKLLGLHTDVGNLTFNSFSSKFPITMIQSAADCFRESRTINQFWHLCLPKTPPLRSTEGFAPICSSISYLNTDEDNNPQNKLYCDNSRTLMMTKTICYAK